MISSGPRLLAISALTAVSVVFQACSFDVPKPGANPHLQIILDRGAAAKKSTLLDRVEDLWGGHGGHIRLMSTGPTSISDFGCFAVNVTGAGVQSNGETQLQNCDSPSNMRGVGIGLISDTVRPGSAIDLEIPAGPSRTIDAYGIFPGSGCGEGGGGGGGGGNDNGGGGYFLGRAVQDILADATVTIGASFSGTPAPDVVCKGGGDHGGGFSVNGVFPYGGTTAGGFSVTISGEGFSSIAVASIDGTPCTSQTVIDGQTISCTVPAGTAGSNKVVAVDNQDGHIASVNFWVYVSGSPFISVNVNTSNAFVGMTPVGTPVELDLNFVNTGSTSATAVASDPFSAPFSTDTGASSCTFGTTLTTGSSCKFTVKFLPASAGPATQSGVNFWTSGGPNITFNGTGL